jgi:hypothetical protein
MQILYLMNICHKHFVVNILITTRSLDSKSEFNGESRKDENYSLICNDMKWPAIIKRVEWLN